MANFPRTRSVKLSSSAQQVLKARTSQFAKDAPKIMQNFLSHGDACTEIETEALRIASQDLNNIDFDTMDIMGPLREYNDVLDRLGKSAHTFHLVFPPNLHPIRDHLSRSLILGFLARDITDGGF